MKKPSLIKRIFSFLFRVCVVLVLMVAIAIGSFQGVTYYLTGSFANLKQTVKEELSQDESTEDETKTSKTELAKNIKNTESKLVFVEDTDSSTMYINLDMYNKKTHALDVILIPSNAQVSVGSDLLKKIQKKMPKASSSVQLQNVARAFGEKKYEIITQILSELTGVTLTKYDIMSKTDFGKLLNMAGEVSYQLDHSISYRDSKGVLKNIDQDNESFDGEQALQIISYLDGTKEEESARLERTSNYLESWIDALLSQNTADRIAKKYESLITSGGKGSQTDTKKLVDSLTDNSVVIRIMQGSESNGVFTLDSQKIKLQISALAKQAQNYSESGSSSAESQTGSDTTTESQTTDADKDYSVELYNAAYVSGLASQWESYLEGEGYRISLVDSYQEEGPLSQTRINVVEEGMEEDLLTYFPNAEVNVVDEISTGGDVQVYIGTDSATVPQTSGTDSYDYGSTDSQ